MSLAAPIADLLFPRACLSCGARGARFLCAQCDASFPASGPSCARCARPLAVPAPACRDCETLRPAFRRARAGAVYEGVARDALIAYKVLGERRAAEGLVARMLVAAADLDGDVVATVPSTRRVASARGWNPAEVLAKRVARALGLPYRRLLRKIRETADQSALGRGERSRNVEDAFVASKVSVPVLLVDDVLTTGATVNACATALRAAGAPWVDVLAFARAR